VLEALATPVGVVLRTIHALYAEFLDPASGLAWGLSIISLTILVRLILFPLFVKQIKSQRRMQQIAPMVKELQKKHKGDRETLNKELMALYKENNANPISGCLPLLLQLPVFFALFTVIREFGPVRSRSSGCRRSCSRRAAGRRSSAPRSRRTSARRPSCSPSSGPTSPRCGSSPPSWS
jgi:YidC/Oxa1 family membrane protein insertase